MISNTLPGVSVVIATYNGAKFLREQIDSILCQTLRPSEIIVCDDRSTDETISILREYQEQGLLKFNINDEKLGVVGNFRKAISLAAPNNYISLADQDDIWMPNKLELSVRKLYEIEKKDQPCFVYSDLILVDTIGTVVNPSFRNELGQDCYNHNLKSLLFGNFINGCTVVMNPAVKKYLDDAPSDYSLNHDYWIALSGFTFGQVACVDHSLVRYRRHSSNTTAVSTFRKQTRIARLWKEINAGMKENRFLKEELVCVRQFYDMFKSSMLPWQLQIFEAFLKLEDKGYLRRKVAAALSLRGLQ